MQATVNDTNIHFELSGDSGLPVVVFINSLGTDFRIWNKVVSVLGRRFRYLRYDKRGHGLSDVSSAPCTIRQHAEDLAGLLDHLGIDRVLICGVSVGGLIAQQFCSMHPDKVTGLVLSNTGFRIGTKEQWNERISTIRENGLPASAEMVMQRWFSKEFRAKRSQELSIYRNMFQNTPLEGYLATCEAIRDADLEEETKKISVPVQCVGGDEDIATPPDLLKALSGIIAGSECVILEGKGHLPCIESPDVIAELILKCHARIMQNNRDVPDADMSEGMRTRRSVLGDQHVDRAQQDRTDFDAPFQDFIVRYAWGDIWNREGLTRRERSLITISLLAALGHEEELAMHIRATANTGATMDDVRETLLHLAVYAGVPVTNTAIKIAKRVYAEMESGNGHQSDAEGGGQGNE